MPSIDPLQLLLVFSVLVFSLTIHESAHAWTAAQLGDPTARLLGRLSLNPAVHVDPIGTILLPLIAFVSNVPIIGWAKPVPVNLRNLRYGRRGYVLVAAAGPASNLLIAIAAAVALRLLAPTSSGREGPSILEAALTLNVLLAVFNMVPVPPLDGGNVLAGLLPSRAAMFFDRLRPFGFLIIYALLLTGVLDRFVFPLAMTIGRWLVSV